MARGARRRVAEWLDLPEEVLLQVPRVELVGHLQLRLSNHRGLVRFNSDEVVVRLPEGTLAIEGRDLVLGWIDHEDLLITGLVRRLTYEGLGEGPRT